MPKDNQIEQPDITLEECEEPLVLNLGDYRFRVEFKTTINRKLHKKYKDALFQAQNNTIETNKESGETVEKKDIDVMQTEEAVEILVKGLIDKVMEIREEKDNLSRTINDKWINELDFRDYEKLADRAQAIHALLKSKKKDRS